MDLKLLIKRLKEIQQDCSDKMTNLDEVDQNLSDIIEDLEDI